MGPVVGVITHERARPRGFSQSSGRTVAYVVSHFPKLTETFVLYELLAIEELGVRAELYPLLHRREPVVHPEAEAPAARANYQPFFSFAIVRVNLRLLLRRPRAYLGALATVFFRTLGSRNYFVGGLAVFPKVAHAAEQMERDGVEHVHCHFADHPAAAGFVIHRLTGIPYTFTAHGSDLHRDHRMLRDKVAEAAKVVTISEYNRRLILDECGEEFGDKVVVVRCGVDTDVFHPRRSKPAADRPFQIVCVAGLEEVKGHRYLIDACHVLADHGLDFECRLVGSGPLRSRLERQIADRELGGRVTLEGPKTRAEVARMLARADVAVCASVWTERGDREGIPVSLMEAMSAGVPVVASDISGIPELVEPGHSGLLVPAGDEFALARAIRRLHDDSELGARLAAAARVTIEREFDVRRNAVRLARYFGSP